MKRRLLTGLILIWTGALSAQSVDLAGNAYVGEGIDADSDQAKAAAKTDLMMQIQNYIRVESTVSKTENERGIRESASQKIYSFSQARLTGITYSSFELEDGRTKVVAVLSKADYRKSMDELAGELKTAWSVLSEREGKVGQAAMVQDWYLLYLKSFYSVEPVPVGEISDLKAWLSGRLRTLFQDMKVSAVSLDLPDNAEDPALLGLECRFGDKVVDGIEIADAKRSPIYKRMKNGMAPVPLYGFPSGRTLQMELAVRPFIDETVAGAELMAIHEEMALTVTRTIQIDFSGFIKIGFSVKPQKSNVIRFVPEISALSVSRFFWDFGDGTVSTEQSPRQFYSDPEGKYLVKLVLNNSEDLVVSKWVTGKGEVADAPVIKQKPVKTDWLSFRGSEVWKPLSGVTQADSVLSVLRLLKTEGRLMFGKSTDFISPEHCYAVVYHPDTKEIAAFLTPLTQGYRNELNGKSIQSVRDAFRGMAVIYLEFK